MKNICFLYFFGLDSAVFNSIYVYTYILLHRRMSMFHVCDLFAIALACIYENRQRRKKLRKRKVYIAFWPYRHIDFINYYQFPFVTIIIMNINDILIVHQPHASIVMIVLLFVVCWYYGNVIARTRISKIARCRSLSSIHCRMYSFKSDVRLVATVARFIANCDFDYYDAKMKS